MQVLTHSLLNELVSMNVVICMFIMCNNIRDGFTVQSKTDAMKFVFTFFLPQNFWGKLQ